MELSSESTPQNPVQEVRLGEPTPLWTEEEVSRAFQERFPAIDPVNAGVNEVVLKKRIRVDGHVLSAHLDYMSPGHLAQLDREGLFAPVPDTRFEFGIDESGAFQATRPLLEILIETTGPGREMDFRYSMGLQAEGPVSWQGVLSAEASGDLIEFGSKVDGEVKAFTLLPGDPKQLSTIHVTFEK